MSRCVEQPMPASLWCGWGTEPCGASRPSCGDRQPGLFLNSDLEGRMMKMQLKAAAGAAAILMALAGGQAHADSSYGARDTAGAVSATASVKINVTTPKLILLRVGSPNAQTVLDFTLQANILT